MIHSRRIANPAEAFALLNALRLPARLNTSEVAVVLGFQEHDIAPLVAARLLTPLGRPAPNAPKHFAAVEIEACARNPEWLSQATRALAKHWLAKNARKGKRLGVADDGQPDLAA